MMPNIKIIDVHKRFGDVVALNGVTLDVRDGEYVCIIGPSGSGKSTLLKIIAGILKPDKGEIYFDDSLVNDIPIDKRGIGLVMQDILLFPHLNVWENITYSPLVRGLSPLLVDELGNEVIGYLDLALDKWMYPDELSRGAQQKVAIARALTAGPKILLLDEPLGSLDAQTAKEFRYELRRLVKDLKLTAIHITHNQEEAMSIADKVVVLRKGRIEQVGTPLELYTSPKTPFVCRFIGGEANFFEGSIESHEGLNAIIKLKGGTLLRAQTDMPSGARVVVALRPEDISLTRRDNASFSGFNLLGGIIEEVHFLGPYLRYVVDTEEGLVIVRAKRSARFMKGEEITLSFNVFHIFPYPKEGLRKAIAYE